MSENTIPEKTQELVSDVAENLVEKVVEPSGAAESVAAPELEESKELQKEEVTEGTELTEAHEELGDLSDKSIAELSDLFNHLRQSSDSMTRSKEAEAIKSAFYKLLIKLKQENGETLDNPFEAVEQNFKAMYADYKKERNEFNKLQEEQKEANLLVKQAIIEELKAIVEGQEDVSGRFPEFRDIQNRWREAGPIPARSFRDVNDTYQFYVEKFYDMVKISRDLRDLDFKKNLEAKIAFCEAAEKLAENDNIVNAFHDLQKLHDQWKEYGPVAKEVREEIWNRFKAATAIINKKYQAHFEGLKGQQQENLEKKTKLCEKLEEIAAAEVSSSAEWNSLSKEIENLQAEWRKIGFATKKENQKIYDRFRAACDAFYARKREHYASVKGDMNENVEKKLALIAQAEALKLSTEWKKTTDQLISLQKQWKEIGAVPRKKSEQLWKRFRAACDEFFANRDANVDSSNDFYGNLKAKRKLIEELLAYEGGENDSEAMNSFNERWNAIGHVPYKEKDNVIAEFRQAMQSKFGQYSGSSSRYSRSNAVSRSPKDTLIAKYNALQQDIVTYENNIGFFAASKNSAPLIKQMQDKIDNAKLELKELEKQIRKAGEEA